MPKHTTTLEFEVYGQRDIDKLRDALQRAGIALEFVESTADQTKRAIHGLNATTKMATATLDNLNNSQKKALNNILKSISAARTGRGAVYKPLIEETVTLETRQQEEARRQAEKTERERERQHRREIARIERERRESRRRLGRMVGFDNREELVGKSVSGPMRVIAYDLVRRTLTEIYSLVNKIGTSISNWIIDGIKFNDELARSQTFFTSLGILGFKGITGQQMTVAEASVSKDPKVSEMYNKSVANSEKVMRRMMAVSALTGQDLGEIVSSTRQSMTDLLNKLNKEGKPGTYLKNVDALNDVSERMVKLASVLRMADPQNRKLSFHMVGLQELFSGTTGEGKDKKKESAGLQNVRSILMREGIRIGEERARKITQYVNTGNLQAAMDVVQDALERSGLGFEQLSNMMNSTLQPAIDGTMMYLRIFNKIFTTDLYNQVVKPFFQATLKHFAVMEQNKTFVSGIEKLGRQFADAADSIIDDFAGIIDYITLVPDFSTKEGRAQYDKMGKEVLGFFTTMTGMENVIDTIKGGAQVMYAFFKVIGQFIWGLMSARDGKGLQDFAKQVESLGQTAQKWGRELREAFEWMLKAIKQNKIEIFGFTFKLTDVVKQLAYFFLAMRAFKLGAGVFGSLRDLIKGLGALTGIGQGKRGGKIVDFLTKERTLSDFWKKKTTATTAGAAAGQPGIMSRIWAMIKNSFSTIVQGFLLFGGILKTLGMRLWQALSPLLAKLNSFVAKGLYEIFLVKIPKLVSDVSFAIRKASAIIKSWPISSEIARFVGGIKDMAMSAIRSIPKMLPDIFRFVWNALGKLNWVTVAQGAIKLTPWGRIATIITAVMLVVAPFLIEQIKKQVPAIVDAMVKGGVGSAGTGLGFNLSGVEGGVINPFYMSSVPTAPVQQPVAPKKPLVLMSSQDKQVVNIGTINVNGVSNAEDVPKELLKQVRNRGQSIQPSIPPDFKPSR